MPTISNSWPKNTLSITPTYPPIHSHTCIHLRTHTKTDMRQVAVSMCKSIRKIGWRDAFLVWLWKFGGMVKFSGWPATRSRQSEWCNQNNVHQKFISSSSKFWVVLLSKNGVQRLIWTDRRQTIIEQVCLEGGFKRQCLVKMHSKVCNSALKSNATSINICMLIAMDYGGSQAQEYRM